MNTHKSNCKVGEGDWMGVEVDESDSSFLKLNPSIAIVTNMGPEHLDHCGCFEAVRQAFRGFVESVPFYGLAVVCLDHPEDELLPADIKYRRLVTYDTGEKAHVQSSNIICSLEGTTCGVQMNLTNYSPVVLKGLSTSTIGRHNVLNALAAIAVASELGISREAIREGLANFTGQLDRVEGMLGDVTEHRLR